MTPPRASPRRASLAHGVRARHRAAGARVTAPRVAPRRPSRAARVDVLRRARRPRRRPGAAARVRGRGAREEAPEARAGVVRGRTTVLRAVADVRGVRRARKHERARAGDASRGDEGPDARPGRLPGRTSGVRRRGGDGLARGRRIVRPAAVGGDFYRVERRRLAHGVDGRGVVVGGIGAHDRGVGVDRARGRRSAQGAAEHARLAGHRQGALHAERAREDGGIRGSPR